MSSKSQDTVEIENQSYVEVGGLDKNDFIVSSSISAVIDSIRSDLSAKLDCETGLPIVSGTIYTTDGVKTSGDVEIYGHSIKVLSGNYIQTDDALGYVQNYSARNSFLQAECSQEYYDRYGIACTGSKGYCILSINTSQRYIRLSGDLTDLANFHAISSDEPFSISFDSGAFSRELRILSVVQDNSEWGHVITDIATRIGDKSENVCRDKWLSDDNAFYCPKAPHVGNTAIPAFYGSHAEGAASKAIQRCTHAEGRNTLADIRYSHAEGSDTYAAEMYSHAEGNTTKALGRASHSEGDHTSASSTNSHAEGMYTKTSNQSEHAQGQYNVSNKKGSGGEFGVNASGNTLHSIGFGTSESTRKNAVEVMQNGDVYVYGVGGYAGNTIAGASTLASTLGTYATKDLVGTISADLSSDYSAKISGLKTTLKQNLSAITELSGLTRTSTIEEVAIDAVLSLRDLISALVDAL